MGSLRAKYRDHHHKSGFKVGDVVVVTDKAKDYELGWGNQWDNSIEVGKVGVIKFDELDEGFVVQFKRGHYTNQYNIPYFVLKRSRKKIKYEPSPDEIYINGQAKSGIKVGDRVKVLRIAKSQEGGWRIMWHERMDGLVGNIYTVMDIAGGAGVRISTSDFNWFLPYFVLEKQEEGS